MREIERNKYTRIDSSNKTKNKNKTVNTTQSMCKMKAVASCKFQPRYTRNIQPQSHKFRFFISEHHRTYIGNRIRNAMFKGIQ